ncbi:hypothetical protein Gogos_015510 [Gossypium gossypioides]|uniref:Disease resistance protein At4g27190-like leucine-rich repeats domain-containing protein n=1 Tax=Gossypium gossypioides TaxID=34282 RepID=A0A7J9C242_GOSGO|nr:hypothetical protein [Gossypium gossypioides]
MTLSLFPQLKSLELKNLQHLSGFCSTSQNKVIEFAFMKSMRIYNCPNLDSFVWRYTRQENQRICSQGDLFDNKVAFPKLQELRVKGCDKLLSIFPSNVLTTFQRLQHLTVNTCGSLQQNVFPASIAKDLPRLRYLGIFYCGVEEIVSKLEEGSESETAVNFELDQLYSLRLWRLPELKCFYPGKHTTKWPMLNKLELVECEKLKILGTQLITNNGQLDPSTTFLLRKGILKGKTALFFAKIMKARLKNPVIKS